MRACGASRTSVRRIDARSIEGGAARERDGEHARMGDGARLRTHLKPVQQGEHGLAALGRVYPRGAVAAGRAVDRALLRRAERDRVLAPRLELERVEEGLLRRAVLDDRHDEVVRPDLQDILE